MQEWAVDLPRRTFLVRAGQGSLALAGLGVTGCGPSAFASAEASDSTPTSPVSPSASGQASASSSNPPSSAAGAVTWERVDLGFVSAYMLARGGEAAVVDTGNPGSESSIEEALKAAGLGWDSVGHVILTHRHGDHVGSLDAVLAKAPDAVAYAGQEDIPSIEANRELTAVGDGDLVFDLQIVATPGHTAGHISVLDTAGGLFVAGDALSTADGKVSDSNPRFTDDMDQAMASIRKIAGLQFETLLVGHGDPILTGASGLVAAFARG
jgi:glyoxylase-like metal-dependent hydrolase (beta-lactamase superfamily II)